MLKRDSLTTAIYWVPGSDCVIAQELDLPEPVAAMRESCEAADSAHTFIVGGAVHEQFCEMNFAERGNYLRSLFCIMVCRDSVDPQAAYTALAEIDCFHYGMPENFDWHTPPAGTRSPMRQPGDAPAVARDNVVAIDRWRSASAGLR